MTSVTPASPDLELIDLFVHGALGIQNKCMEPQSIQFVCRGERKKIGKVTELIGGGVLGNRVSRSRDALSN